MVVVQPLPDLSPLAPILKDRFPISIRDPQWKNIRPVDVGKSQLQRPSSPSKKPGSNQNTNMKSLMAVASLARGYPIFLY